MLFNLRQAPARLFVIMRLNMAVRAGALIISPRQTATMRAVVLSCLAVLMPSGSGQSRHRRGIC